MVARDYSVVGPKIASPEKGVHIIRIPRTLGTGEPTGSHPTPAARQAAEKLLAQVKPGPTDIVVWARQPWHVVNGDLKDHPQVHADFPQTILTLSVKEKEKAVWWSEAFFEIVGIDYSHHAKRISGAPKNPFTSDFVTQLEVSGGEEFYVVRSTSPVDTAVGQQYKISFKMGVDAIDPDMSCTP
ncbi:MAG: hypothetical protein HY047_14870 [Acidobacteria bacterium]|nr:hypothetical protein [Acidobacteriota bacterium]